MTTYYPQNEREERILETMRSEPDVDFTAGLPMPESRSDAEVISAIRAELWEALRGRDIGGDRSLIGMVKQLRAELDEARTNRRGEFELRMMAEAALQQARREYGAFGTLSGETLAQMDAAMLPSVGEARSSGSSSSSQSVGERAETIENSPLTPSCDHHHEIEQLIAKWKNKAKWLVDKYPVTYEPAQVDALNQCADDLAALQREGRPGKER